MSTPAAVRDLAEENAGLHEKLAETKAALAEERTAECALRMVVAEPSLELQQAKDELAEARGVISLRRPAASIAVI